jgi:hypothetical protein
MQSRKYKWLQALIVLALVIAPLRAGFAMPTSTVSDAQPHCADMAMPATDMQAGVDADNGHACDHGCNGDCCDDNCNTCAHSVISLPTGSVLPLYNHDTRQFSPVSSRFPHRTRIPPLRPPASL